MFLATKRALKMNFQTKSAVIGSIGTLAVGTVAYFLHKYLKVNDEIMEIIFTHDRLEDRTKNVKYLEISHLNFSPRNLVRIEQYINSAKKTIDAAVYLFNVKQLGAAIIRAYERGVSVRIVGCSSMQGATGTQFGELHRAGNFNFFLHFPSYFKINFKMIGDIHFSLIFSNILLFMSTFYMKNDKEFIIF